jgi:hypothetical protein
MTTQAPLLRRYRSTWTQAAGWFVVVCAVLGIVDSLVRATSGARVGTVLLAAGAALVAWVWALRPYVSEQAERLLVVNPLRTASLPWSSISDVDGVDVVRVTAGDLVVRCFAMPRRMRLDRGAITSGGHDIALDPVTRFRDMAETFGQRGGEPARQWWAWPAVVATVAGVLLAVVGLLLMASA